MIDIILSFLAGAVVALIIVHLIDMQVTRQAQREVATLNGIDLFAEYHGMQRRTGESDAELIDRVNRGE